MAAAIRDMPALRDSLHVCVCHISSVFWLFFFSFASTLGGYQCGNFCVKLPENNLSIKHYSHYCYLRLPMFALFGMSEECSVFGVII